MHACGDPACAYVRGLHNGEGEEGCYKCGRVGMNTERIQEKWNGGHVWDLERYKPERGASCIVRMWVGRMRCAIEDGELVSFREMTHARRRAWGHSMHVWGSCVRARSTHARWGLGACVHVCRDSVWALGSSSHSRGSVLCTKAHHEKVVSEKKMICGDCLPYTLQGQGWAWWAWT